MHDNPITAKAIRPILQDLQCNNTLEWLRLPFYPDDVRRDIISVKEKINKTREESKESCAKLRIECVITMSDLFHLSY